MPINPLGYSCIKKLQRDNLWHAYNEPMNFYSVLEWSLMQTLFICGHGQEDRAIFKRLLISA